MDIDPFNASVLVGVAKLRMKLRYVGNFEEIKDLFHTACQLEPQNGYVLSAYAQFLHQFHDNEGAKIYFEKALDVNGNDYTALVGYDVYIFTDLFDVAPCS
jgi:Tfp pilus assembly protein PilF